MHANHHHHAYHLVGHFQISNTVLSEKYFEHKLYYSELDVDQYQRSISLTWKGHIDSTAQTNH